MTNIFSTGHNSSIDRLVTRYALLIQQSKKENQLRLDFFYKKEE